MSIRIPQGLLSILLCGGVLVSIITGCGKPTAVVTKEQFQQIHNGMTYQQVKQLIGTDGIASKPAAPPATGTHPAPVVPDFMKIYTWTNKDGSSVTVLCVKDVVISATPKGLK